VISTLATQWQQHADTLPIDISQAERRRQERLWYTERLEELERAPKTQENTALLVEACNWARLTIGRVPA
jgi:hypothetical protein